MGEMPMPRSEYAARWAGSIPRCGGSRVYGDELQRVRRRVQQRHGLLPRAVQGAGVDDARAADALVTRQVGMAVEQVVEALGVQRRAHRPGVVAVLDVQQLAAE